MLDVQLFGLNPRWHHLTNLLFHIANTLLLFFVFHRMTKAPWKSAFVAALFALHPLHVESVAWVAERKDVLSTFFWMLTMGAYIHYVEHPSGGQEFFRFRFRSRSHIFCFRPYGKTHAGNPSFCPAAFGLLAPAALRSRNKSAQEIGSGGKLGKRAQEPLCE